MNTNFGLGVILGFIAAAALTYTRVEVAEWRAARANSQVAAQNACITAWADEVSKLDTTNERMCEFMVANRLICEVPVP